MQCDRLQSIACMFLRSIIVPLKALRNLQWLMGVQTPPLFNVRLSRTAWHFWLRWSSACKSICFCNVHVLSSLVSLLTDNNWKRPSGRPRRMSSWGRTLTYLSMPHSLKASTDRCSGQLGANLSVQSATHLVVVAGAIDFNEKIQCSNEHGVCPVSLSKK